MKSLRRSGALLLFLAFSSLMVVLPAPASMASVPVILFVDFDDPLSGQFQAFLQQEIVALGGILLVSQDHISVEECAIVSVTGFRYRGESGAELGFAFSYAFGYAGPDEPYYYLYHNVLVGYPKMEGLSWAAAEIAEDFDLELELSW